MSQARPVSDTSARKLVAVVGIAAALVVISAMVTAVARNRTVPFSKAAWDSGKGIYTTGNPRLRMRDELVARLQVEHLGQSEVRDLLGEPDTVAITTPGGTMSAPPPPSLGEWSYVLGVMPKTTFVGRRLMVLIVYFDGKKRVQGAFANPMDFPAGSTVSPTKTSPLFMKPARISHHAKAKP